jgi:glycosyltransferase involved in cell wall biosynthesis
MKPLKILFLTHNDPLAPRLLLEINTLLTEGYEVRVLGWKICGKTYPYNFPATFIYRNGKTTFAQSLKKGFLSTLVRLAVLYPATLKEIRRSSYDVIHCSHLALLPLAIMAKALSGGKIVYDSYEIHTLNISSKLKNRTLGRLVRFFLEKAESLCLVWVDAVITIPSLGNRELLKFASRVRNVAVIFNVPSLAGLSREKTFSSPPTAAYIGGLMRNKGLFVMLKAAAILARSYPDFRLVMIGAMKEDPGEVERCINALQIKDRVVIHDWVQPEELGGYLASAWVGLAPYQPDEHFAQNTVGKARKNFDYMKQGLPVVGSAFGEIDRVVAEENAGILVDTTNPEALAAGIKRLIEDDSLRNWMATNGINAVRQKYNWEKESEKLKGIYAALSSQPQYFS